jgi:hypothetical protein
MPTGQTAISEVGALSLFFLYFFFNFSSFTSRSENEKKRGR